MKKQQRSLDLISSELHAALNRETGTVIDIGRLLLEARSQLDHGQWLPWLEDNFSASARTAENYMSAARLAAKYESVANLKLQPSALYLLGGMDDPNSMFNDKVVDAILKEAETKWVGSSRAWEIAWSMKPKPSPKAEDDDEVDDDDFVDPVEAEVGAILDGPPPELPPAPDTTTYDVTLPPFEQAVRTLASLQTKPLERFSNTSCKAEDIRAISNFLREVADAVDKKARLQAA